MIPIPQLIVGITGAIVGVIGWLCVGIYIQRREVRRRARNADFFAPFFDPPEWRAELVEKPLTGGRRP